MEFSDALVIDKTSCWAVLSVDIDLEGESEVDVKFKDGSGTTIAIVPFVENSCTVHVNWLGLAGGNAYTWSVEDIGGVESLSGEGFTTPEGQYYAPKSLAHTVERIIRFRAADEVEDIDSSEHNILVRSSDDTFKHKLANLLDQVMGNMGYGNSYCKIVDEDIAVNGALTNKLPNGCILEEVVIINNGSHIEGLRLGTSSGGFDLLYNTNIPENGIICEHEVKYIKSLSVGLDTTIYISASSAFDVTIYLIIREIEEIDE